MDTNTLTLCGTLDGLPQFSHENHGHRFFRFYLEVPRLSGTVDRLPVVVREDLLNTLDLSGGTMLRVRGQLRSHNCRTRPKLLLFAFATELEAVEAEPCNEISLSGHLCKAPILRRTPLGRDICDLIFAVPRSYGRSDYLPCILWGTTAQTFSPCPVGTPLTLKGRFQSRPYHKYTDSGLEEHTAYEVSVSEAERGEEEEAR